MLTLSSDLQVNVVWGLQGSTYTAHTLCPLASYWHVSHFAGILEVARTGRVALSRESGVNTELLGRLRGAVGKVMVQ